MAKSSAYPPLDSLVDLACRDGVDIRPTLLRVLTDLYVQKPAHSAEEETQYVELALRADRCRRCADPRRGGGQPVGLPGRAGGDPRQACQPPPHSRPRQRPPDRGRADSQQRPGRIILCGQQRRTPPDPDQSRRGGRNGGAPAGAGLERSDPPPGKRGAAAQPRRIRPHARTRARHQPRAGRAHRARSLPASRSWSPPRRSA